MTDVEPGPEAVDEHSEWALALAATVVLCWVIVMFAITLWIVTL